MVPTMVVFGLLTGRWWRVAIPLGGIAWAVLLLSMHTIEPSSFVAATLFGAANTAVGAAVFAAGRAIYRTLA